jgi:rubrerythrin
VFDGLFSRVWKLYEGSPGKYGAHLTVAEYRRTHPEQNPSPVYLQKKMRAEALIKDEQEGMETYSTLSGYYASTPAALQFYNMALDEERHRDAIREMSEQGFIENPEVPDELMDQFSRIYSSLSPENLTCDGELSRGQVRVKHAGLMRELRNLERQAGRSISEDEVCKWWLAKRGR